MYLITSPGPSDGKTTVTANLAITQSKLGKRVLVLDCDLRRPSLHKYFGIGDRSTGLSNFLSDETGLEDVITKTEYKDVDLISAGPTPPNPAELLVLPKMDHLLEILGERYDTVIIDSPPLLPVVDASVIASKVDGVIVVTSSGKTRFSNLSSAVRALRVAGSKLVCVVINRNVRGRIGYGYGRADNYYGYYGDDNGNEVDGGAPGTLAVRTRGIVQTVKRIVFTAIPGNGGR